MQLVEATIAGLQVAMNEGQTSASQLTTDYLERIAQLDSTLHSIIEINPDALAIAEELDHERQIQGPRGPLHGIPILLKESVATRDKMETTAGSLALLGSRPPRDAFVAAQLRAAGAVILGKTNLSEWAGFRSKHSSSGWSARGGQALNPYVLDRTPCGSSSGSAVAVAANLAVAALGTETYGSILCPAAATGVVGIKPTVGLTSRAGVIPLAHSQDTVGPLARTMSDAAMLLAAIIGPDPHDLATTSHDWHISQPESYMKYLDADGLRGARIGVARACYFGHSPKVDAVIEQAIARMRGLGAKIVDPADIPTARQIQESESETTVLLYEFKADLNKYLAELESSPLRTLAEIIAFNEAHAEREMPHFGQELFLKSQETGTLDDEIYLQALEENRHLSREQGIDAVMDKHCLDALVMPTLSPAWCIDLVNGDQDHYSSSCAQPAALAGYPAITVPVGFVSELPIGITFMGRSFSEPTLIKLAYAFEQATQARRAPRSLPMLSLNPAL